MANLDHAANRPFQRLGVAKSMLATAAAVGLLVPASWAALRLSPQGQPYFPRAFLRALTRALGVRLVVHGAPARRGGVLFVANHISYLDIPVLGGCTLAAFIAKSEVAGWGLFGWMADLRRTIYVDRERRTRAGEQRDEIAARLHSGGDVILFPEGTNSDGVSVLPFKSSLFAVTDGPEAVDFLIQPVTIAYTDANGMPITRGMLPDIAWVGTSELVPHAKDFMGLGKIRAEVRFHPAVKASEFANRKVLTAHCHRVISASYRKMMRGGHSY